MSGPLNSLKVVEFTGLGPAPLAGQLLADLGAEVIVIDRASADVDPTVVNRRGKKSVALNLKSASGLEAAMRIVEASDILIEGFRPGVMERLGLGPKDCPESLVYGRMTGWGQEGPWSKVAGHDINYLAMTGALHAMGPADRPPTPPLNLVADFGGGTMFLLFGILAAVIEKQKSGKGQVVDAAMVDGVSAMMGLIHGMIGQGAWAEHRGANWLDGSSHFYRCYECADGKYLSVGALEPQFFKQLVELADLPIQDTHAQMNPESWRPQAASFAEVFKSRPRDAWMALFEKSDACVAPVLDFKEAALHPVNRARHVFYEEQGVWQSSPAPRFSRSANHAPHPPKAAGADSASILEQCGYSPEEIAKMREKGAIT